MDRIKNASPATQTHEIQKGSLCFPIAWQKRDATAKDVPLRGLRWMEVYLSSLRHPELVSGSIVQRPPLRERKRNRASQIGVSQRVREWAEK
jgi:hypothetical protein